MDSDRALPRFAEIAGTDESEVRLDEGALEVARIAYPDLEADRWLRRLDDLADRTRGLGDPDRVSLGFVDRLNRSLFEVEGFRGNEAEYYDPHNSYLNDVLERRLGIPITLSLVYMEVARRLEYPVEGIGFPGHFLVRARLEARHVYLDPFRGGEVLTPADFQVRLDHAFGAAVALDPRFLEPVGPRHILARMLNNLKRIYLSSRDYPRALAAAERLVLLHADDLDEVRDRGKLRFFVGDGLGAARDLERYVAGEPEAEDRDEVRTLLQAIRRRQAIGN